MANVAQSRSRAFGTESESRMRKALAAALPLVAFAAVSWLCGCSSEPAPRDTHSTISDSGDISTWFYYMLLWLDLAIGVAVCAVWGLALVKFKRAAGDDTLPSQAHGDLKMELLWTSIPTVIVVCITVPMLVGVFKLSKRPDQNQAVIEIDVTGKQWWWEFNYKNGISTGIHTANEVHVQANAAVVMNMTASDVIHAWWIPRLAGKRDATPGRNYPLYYTPREPGIYDGQCAELCGASHALMGTKLFVHPPAGEVEVEYKGQKIKLESYEAWARHQQQPAKAPSKPELEQGAKLFKEKTCVTCHIVRGLEGAESAGQTTTTGPNLTHVGSRMTIGANTLDNTVDNLVRWVSDPAAVKPGSKMPNLGLKPDEAKAIAAYLKSLE